MPKNGWTSASKSSPCPVCGKPDWCSIGTNFIHCMRVESNKPTAKGGWLHVSGTSLQPPPPPRHQRRIPDSELRLKWEPVAAKAFVDGDRLIPQLAQSLGVSAASLLAIGAGYGETTKGSPYWTFPEKNAKGWVIGINRRFLVPLAGKKRLYAEGSRAGLTYEPNWHSRTGPIWIVEGASDCAAGIMLDMAVIGRPSNTGGIDHLVAMLGKLGKRRIIVLGERDQKSAGYCANMTPPHDPKCQCCLRCWPGLAGAKKTAGAMAKRLGRSVAWMLPPVGCKDLREWVRGIPPWEISKYVKAAKRGILPTANCGGSTNHT
jgi:hypothetical protein